MRSGFFNFFKLKYITGDEIFIASRTIGDNSSYKVSKVYRTGDEIWSHSLSEFGGNVIYFNLDCNETHLFSLSREYNHPTNEYKVTCLDYEGNLVFNRFLPSSPTPNKVICDDSSNFYVLSSTGSLQKYSNTNALVWTWNNDQIEAVTIKDNYLYCLTYVSGSYKILVLDNNKNIVSNNPLNSYLEYQNLIYVGQNTVYVPHDYSHVEVVLYNLSSHDWKVMTPCTVTTEGSYSGAVMVDDYNDEYYYFIDGDDYLKRFRAIDVPNLSDTPSCTVPETIAQMGITNIRELQYFDQNIYGTRGNSVIRFSLDGAIAWEFTIPTSESLVEYKVAPLIET